MLCLIFVGELVDSYVTECIEIRSKINRVIEVEIRRPLEWRGTMAPRDVNAWWKAYERFILHYAKIAAEEDVAMLSVGSELGTTETWRDRWFALISKVQKSFRGKLVYSSNWDRFDKVSFWERLDYMGVTAYNDLTPDANASERDLTDAWRRVRAKLVEFSRSLALASGVRSL